ncbi:MULTISPECIES: SGNH/GDSL hydrolase family protein [unclassified Nocardioides]|uniref:SGNH/GDSL hydrolase family protein n=1 Tax=unclassified Nocardioides TaxID=2615069 RepID=UPI003014B4AB
MRARVVVLLLLLVGLAVPVTAEAQPWNERIPVGPELTPTPPVRVLFVGDSITAGRSGDTSYRYWVWRQFQDAGVRARFVGTTTGRRGGDGYALTDHGFQPWHAAKGGTTYADHLPRVRALVRHLRPDVIVLGLGFNDVKVASPARTAARARAYLDRVWAVDPDVRVVLNEVTFAARPGASRRNLRRTRYDELLREIARADRRVEVARVVSGPCPAWDPVVHSFDGIHPNALGELVVARHVVDALVRADVLPSYDRTGTPGYATTCVAPAA